MVIAITLTDNTLGNFVNSFNVKTVVKIGVFPFLFGLLGHALQLVEVVLDKQILTII